MKPTIVIHDVLQARFFSASQERIFKMKTPYEWFEECVSHLGGQKLKMVVIANGVSIYPDWVKLIKTQGWEVQCHGLIHHDMQHLTEKEVYDELKEAKYLLEDCFQQKIVDFYPPRLKTSPYVYEVCMKLNLNLMMNRYRIDDWITDKTIPEFYIHYWSSRHIELCRQLEEQ